MKHIKKNSKYLPRNCKKKQLEDVTLELDKLIKKSFCISSPSDIIKYFHEFIVFINNKDKKIEEEFKNIHNPFKNGQEDKEYKVEFSLPECIKNQKLIGLEELGLKYEFTESSCVVYGKLKDNGEKEVELQVNTNKARSLKKKFSFYINPDPRKLWKNLPVPDGIEYPKPDEDKYCFWGASKDGQPQINMIAASKRGRSHAHEAKPRDDDFALRHCPESDWYIIAVADGAGSSAFSRKGSEIACKTAVEFCEEKLKTPDNDFDVFLKNLLENTEKHKNQLMPKAYEILVHAAHHAHKAIQKEAEEKNRSANLYATTLLLTICKKLPDESYIILSFNIGDGAIGIVSKENGTMKACLNCKPDEGEFGGQTRFVTMSEVFKDPDLINRIHVKKIKDITAIISMTDGISDAKFETSANLNNPDKWIELWNDINSSVCLDNETTVEKKLLDWLDFWSAGNHDDRTIAILYSHE